MLGTRFLLAQDLDVKKLPYGIKIACTDYVRHKGLKMRDILVYVENRLSPSSPYFVSQSAVLTALGKDGLYADVRCYPASAPDYDFLATAHYFIGSGFDTERIKNHGSSLRLVHCTSAGVDRYLPLDWLPDGAMFTNSSGVHGEKGGAFGLMTVLMLCEGVPRHIENQKLHRWDPALSKGIASKTILFLGFGDLGQAIAARLKPLGPKIIAVTRSGQPNAGADQTVLVEEVHTVIGRADCLVVCCPLTPATRGMVDREMISKMKRGSTLFNIARGPIVDNRALVDALTDGHLSGAALDVFDQEPLPSDSNLWDVPNLIIFPHISCDDAEGYIDKCLSIFAGNVERYLTGRPLNNVIDTQAGY
ncbi:D-2-hydroxyacid dehydrogenase [Rhizobium pusense]|nr:D-2-hydroxyacid dehydrogenase [Agrobacterium pusense]MDH2092348.1 D-2-hydroxyacid dehydrogenase [Agrobacterium pusense]WCK27631.1 D-2-hydroxyacid dehydrogenase [Agrobacterium pusense]